MVDIAHQFPGEILDRGEDATRDNVAFDLGEPEFDLVEPRAIGGSEVEPNVGMVVKELANTLRTVGGQVVEDHMNILSCGLTSDQLFEEGNKLLAGVAARRAPPEKAPL
jgi:hypothetical protein